jgi:uncharacterized membrane protein AbrB (regulator of aidB expression)
VEAQAFCTNIVVMTITFVYEHIFIQFGWTTINIDQGTHFSNDVIKYLIDHFILNVLVLLFTIHKEMFKLGLLTRFLEPH